MRASSRLLSSAVAILCEWLSLIHISRAVVREGTEIVEVTPRVGAESVEGNFESYLCAVAVMDSVATYPDAFDAVIQCGFGEHGVEGLREIVDVPVVDMTEAAAHFAMLLGNRFTIVTTLDRAVPLIEERLLTFGLDRHCANVRSTSLSVLELEDQERAKDAIREQARIALVEDHAEVIVLGCGGMAGLDREMCIRDRRLCWSICWRLLRASRVWVLMPGRPWRSSRIVCSST